MQGPKAQDRSEKLREERAAVRRLAVAVRDTFGPGEEPV
jgi:hypothetical protein